MRIKHPLAAAIILSSIGAPTLANANEIEEITVTATKRQGVEVQDLAASISVYGAEELKNGGVQSMTDLTNIEPSLTALSTQSTSSTRIGIRGLSTPANNVGFEAAVGVSIDGVPRARTGIALSELPELASVEVLRGPQGTLFGRNTTAGVININTAKPNPEGGGFVEVSMGNYNARSVQAAINLPINDQWTGRIDAKDRERDGFLDNVLSDTDVNSIDRSMVRGQLTFEGEDSSLRLIADWGEDQSICCGAMFTIVNTPAARGMYNQLAGGTAYGSTDLDDLEIGSNITPTNDIDEWGVSAEYNLDIGGNNFTSISSYRDWESLATPDGDMSGADFVGLTQYSANTVFTQELRLQGESGAVNWLAGAFYMHDKVEWVRNASVGKAWNARVDLSMLAAAPKIVASLQQALLNPNRDTDKDGQINGLINGLSNGVQAYGTLTGPNANTPSILALINGPTAATTFLDDPATNVNNDMDLTTKALAVFAHAEISLREDLTATLGVRYSDEQKDLSYVMSSDAVGARDGCPIAKSLAVSGSPLAAFAPLICTPTGNTNFNNDVAFPNGEQGTLKDDAISGTAKLAWAANEDALLYASYSRGFKSGGFNLDRAGLTYANPTPSALMFDAEEVDAVEMGWNSQWADGAVTFNGAVYSQDVSGLQQLNFTGSNFEVAQGDYKVEGMELSLSARPSEALMLTASYARVDAENELTGKPPEGQPEDTLTASATLFLPIPNSLVGTFNINGRYSDGTFQVADAGILGDYYGESYTVVNARMSVTNQEGSWSASIFAQNLTDEIGTIDAFAQVLQSGATGNIQSFTNMPRMYGAEVRFNF